MNKIKLGDILSNKKFAKIIVAVALLGIILIAFSDFTPNENKVSEVETNTDYEDKIELKIKQIVSAITGEKNPDVMISLSASEQYVYAKETKENEYESEENYIIVKNSDGDQEAIVVTQLEPEIKGVVIASKFAYDFSMKESIVSAISTVLDLPSNKVCVVVKK